MYSAVRPWFLTCLSTRWSVRDLQLLFLGVARDLEHFHAVPQRRRDRIEHVGRRDEQHFGQIERHVEVVIAERVVLLRIEHLEQRRRRIAAEVGAELVDLVEDEHRVLRLGPAQPLDDLSGQRADVGAAMAADFGLVAHAAERHADELAAERFGNRPGQRRLADAGRPDEAENRALHRRDSACGRPGTRGCGPWPSRGRSDRRRARSWSAAGR